MQTTWDGSTCLQSQSHGGKGQSIPGIAAIQVPISFRFREKPYLKDYVKQLKKTPGIKLSGLHTHTQRHAQPTHKHIHKNTHTQYMYMRTMTNFTALISAFIVQSSPRAGRHFQCRDGIRSVPATKTQRERKMLSLHLTPTLLAKLLRHLWSDSLNRKAVRTGKGVLTQVFPILWEPVRGSEIPPYRAFRGWHQRCVYTDSHTEWNPHTISEEAAAGKRSLFQSPVALDKRHFEWFSHSSLMGPSQSLGVSLLA